ncbi:MAG: CopG family ribbon-helix-helix protein [Thermodesulfovibrionales bacterium]
MSTTFSVRIDEETKGRLESLAKSTARSRAYLINEAVKEYLAINEWQIKEIKQAVKEADKPGAKFIDHEKVKAKWEGKLAHSVVSKGR